MILGVDLGTNIAGWALLRPDGTRAASGVWTLCDLARSGRPKTTHIGRRLGRLARALRARLDGEPLELVAFEDVDGFKGVRNAKTFGGTWGLLIGLCELHGVPWLPVEVHRVKAAALGRAKRGLQKGGAKREVLRLARERWGDEVVSEDEAHALWVAAVATESQA